jgi:hypothetical protein
MWVVADVHSYYYWAPLPKNVVVTDQDIASRRVKPNANNDGYLAREKRKGDTQVTMLVSEQAIIARIIHELMPNQGCMLMTRKEAVGQVIARNVMPDHAHPKFAKRFVVHDHHGDDGPDEAEFRRQLQPYVEAIHEASGEPLIDPDMVEEVVAAYMEPTTNEDHVAHLHAKFKLKHSAAPAKAVDQ